MTVFEVAWLVVCDSHLALFDLRQISLATSIPLAFEAHQDVAFKRLDMLHILGHDQIQATNKSPSPVATLCHIVKTQTVHRE